MLDQEFSSKNLRDIFDIENRKGNYLEKQFFPDVFHLSDTIRRHKGNIKRSYKIINKLKNKTLLKPSIIISKRIIRLEKSIKDKFLDIRSLKRTKELALTNVLTMLSKAIQTAKVEVKLTQVTLPSGKMVYQINDDPVSYFTLKMAQKNISLVFNCRQADKTNVISQLDQALGDKYPKMLVRTDIGSFFESINRNILLEIVRNETTLSTKTREVIFEVLKNYTLLAKTENGIPRGISISPILAELYLQKMDASFRSLPDVLLYTRYVDDIIILFDSSVLDRGDGNSYIDFVKSELKDIGLTINAVKTFAENVPCHAFDFDYLGYKFRFTDNVLSLDMSTDRKNKYLKRIDLAFDDYKNYSSVNEKSARRLLMSRLKFLAGNTHLVNNKRKAMVGVYFSNSLITSTQTIESLDKHVVERAKSMTKKNALMARIKKLKFKDGFESKKFFRFTTKQLGKIIRVWKYEV